MKLNKRLCLLLFIALLSSSFLLGGCQKSKDPWVIKIGDKSYTMADFAYDIYLVESQAKDTAAYFQETMGMDYWTYEKEGISVRDIAKNTILTRFVMYVILSEQSQIEGFSLSETELSENKTKTAEFLSSLSNEEKKKYSFQETAVSNTLNRLTLGDNYYIKMSENFIVDENAINSSILYNDYREYKTECLYVPTVKSENQQLIQFTEQEIAQAQLTIADAMEKINNGADLQTLVSEDSSLTYYTRNFIMNDKVPEQEYKEAASQLQNGEYSSIVETSYGYYIIKMIENNSSARYEEAINTAIEDEKKKQFQAVYDILESQYTIEINTEVWDNLVIGSSNTK